MIGEVLHPTVFSGAVPVLHALGNGDDGARDQRNGFLAPFLIPAATAHADQHLYRTVVNVPVVAAARLEADVAEATCGIEDGKEAVPLVPGTVIAVPEGVKHWHGAAKDSWMQHLTYHADAQPGNSNEWLEPVSDEQYDTLK